MLDSRHDLVAVLPFRTARPSASSSYLMPEVVQAGHDRRTRSCTQEGLGDIHSTVRASMGPARRPGLDDGW